MFDDFFSKDLWTFSDIWPTLSIGLITAFIVYYRWKQCFWSRNGVKGPTPLPFLGTTWSFLFKPLHQVEQKLIQKYGKIVGLYDGMEPGLIIADPDIIREVCVKDFQAFPQGFYFKYLHPIEEKFVVTMWGDDWKRLRSLLSPTFTSGKLKAMFPLIQACNQECMKVMQKDVAVSDTLDLRAFWGRYNMDVIAKCFFATQLIAYDEESNRLVNNFQALTKGFSISVFFNLMFPEWAVKLLKIGMFPGKELEFLHDLTLQVIENRRKGSEAGFNDFLQLLIESEVDSEQIKTGKLTVEEVISSAIMFLIAGFESTSTLLSWTCWRLAFNQNVQEKLYQEVSQVDDLTYDKVMTLPYLEAVLNESLRIDPPAVQTYRTAHHDHNISRIKLLIPKGTKISIPIYSIHHDPENFSEPERFNPDRFLPENKDSIRAFTFLPFGAGPRICIGMRFAMLNAKYALANFVKNYQLVVNGETTRELVYRSPTVILSTEQLQVGIKSRLDGIEPRLLTTPNSPSHFTID